MQSEKNLPERKFRAGAVSATIWKNKAKDKEASDYYSVSFERSYQNAKGEWATTNSLRVNDLPKAMLVLQKAYEHLALRDGEEL